MTWDEVIKSVNDIKEKCQGLTAYQPDDVSTFNGHLNPLWLDWNKAQSERPEQMTFVHLHTKLEREAAIVHIQVQCVDCFLTGLKGVADAWAARAESAEEADSVKDIP